MQPVSPRVDWLGMLGTNTAAYLPGVSVTKKKVCGIDTRQIRSNWHKHSSLFIKSISGKEKSFNNRDTCGLHHID
jgi:hypothetical protein